LKTLKDKKRERVERKEETTEEEREREEEKSVYSGERGASSCRNGGSWSGDSRLSEREVEKIKKWVVDRKERRSNIIIKG